MVTRFAPFDYTTRSRVVAPPARQLVPMDAVRSEDSVELLFDLPGFDPASIELTVDKFVLSLSAERQWAPREGDSVISSERRHGSVLRQIRLSDSLDTTQIAAQFDNGVLTVRIPVAETAQPHKVEIAIGSPQLVETSGTSEDEVAHSSN